MFRSPPAARMRSKLADKAKVQRTLSVDSAPVETASDSEMVDTKVIEECVAKYLLRDNVCDALVNKLSEHIKTAVEKALEDTLQVYNNELNRLRGEVSALTKQVSVLDDKLKSRTDDIEQYQRRNNLRMFGVVETKDEDTDQLVVDLFREKMEVDLRVESIERSHRLGSKQRPREDG